MIPLRCYQTGLRDTSQQSQSADTDDRSFGRAKAVERPTIQTGIYRHFKGRFYRVIGVAPLVDSSEWYVIYRPLYGDGELVARSYSQFTDSVVRDGRECPRF